MQNKDDRWRYMNTLAEQCGVTVTYRDETEEYSIVDTGCVPYRIRDVEQVILYLHGYAARDRSDKKKEYNKDDRWKVMHVMAERNGLVVKYEELGGAGYEILCNECTISRFTEVEVVIGFIRGWQEHMRIAKNAEYKNPLSWDGYKPNSVDRLSALEKAVAGCVSNGECLARSLHSYRMGTVQAMESMESRIRDLEKKPADGPIAIVGNGFEENIEALKRHNNRQDHEIVALTKGMTEADDRIVLMNDRFWRLENKLDNKLQDLAHVITVLCHVFDKESISDWAKKIRDEQQGGHGA